MASARTLLTLRLSLAFLKFMARLRALVKKMQKIEKKREKMLTSQDHHGIIYLVGWTETKHRQAFGGIPKLAKGDGL